MPYTKNDKMMLEKVYKIIRMNGEVFVEYYYQRSYDYYYFINSFDEFNNLLTKVVKNDFVTIYKNRQFMFRGLPDKHFVTELKAEYLKIQGSDYLIYDYVSYPQELEEYGSGSSRKELNEDIEELINYHQKLQVCFGPDPRTPDRLLNINENNEIIVVSGA